MKQINLSAAGASHAAVIAALHGRCFGQTDRRGWDVKAVTELLAMAGAFAFLASRQDHPIGYAMARVAADEAEIISLGVVPRVRRRGVASLLLEAVIKRTATAGVRRIFLEVAADNSAAFGLYRGRGFEICGRRPGYYPRPHGAVDADVLALDLKK